MNDNCLNETIKKVKKLEILKKDERKENIHKL